MFLKELHLIRKDKYALLLVFALPMMIMGTMYVAINQRTLIQVNTETGKNVDALVIAVVDADPTNTFPGEDLSANFTWYLAQSPTFIVYEYTNEDAARISLYQEIVKAYVVIPYGFEGNITGDIPAFVDL
ncbi:MAG: ABC transporter permease, partial [Candidatus Thorarchaeota archaeon]